MKLFDKWSSKSGWRREVWFRWTYRSNIPRWIKQCALRNYYEKVHGMTMDGRGKVGGTMLPVTGKGKFVSVYNRGQYIDLVAETDGLSSNVVVKAGDVVRIIPVQYNHGIMVEVWRDGKSHGRYLLTIDDLISKQLKANERWDKHFENNKLGNHDTN